MNLRHPVLTLAAGLAVAAALAGSPALAAPPALAAGPTATTTTWSVTPGGPFSYQGSAPAAVITDTTTGLKLICPQTVASGRLTAGSGEPSTIGKMQITASICYPPAGGLGLRLGSGTSPVHATRYNAATGKTAGSIVGLVLGLAGSGCVIGTHDPSTGTPGNLHFSYANSTAILSISSPPGLVLEVSSACAGLLNMNTGDTFSFRVSAAITPAQTITGTKAVATKAAVASTKAGVASSKAATASPATWTVSNGGLYIAQTEDRLDIQDITNGHNIECDTNWVSALSFRDGSGLNGNIATVKSVMVPFCQEFAFDNLVPGHLPWPIHATSYNSSTGVTTGRMSGIHLMLTGANCSVVIDGTAADADDGYMRTTYTNPRTPTAPGELGTSGYPGGNLHFYDVTGSGCNGIANDGDVAKFLFGADPISYPGPVTPVITSP